MHAIVYFATPFFSDLPPTEMDSEDIRGFVNPMFSYGATRNELVYIVEGQTATGRATLIRYNASNFTVVDDTIPDGWSTVTIDLYEETVKAKQLHQKYNNDYSDYFTENFVESLKLLKKFRAKIIVSGDKKFHSFEYLHAVCDDNVDNE